VNKLLCEDHKGFAALNPQFCGAWIASPLCLCGLLWRWQRPLSLSSVTMNWDEMLRVEWNGCDSCWPHLKRHPRGGDPRVRGGYTRRCPDCCYGILHVCALKASFITTWALSETDGRVIRVCLSYGLLHRFLYPRMTQIHGTLDSRGFHARSQAGTDAGLQRTSL